MLDENMREGEEEAGKYETRHQMKRNQQQPWNTRISNLAF